jgi:hypothetical protein
MLQALPCIVAAQVLHPTPGSRVLDMCAAPGGESLLQHQGGQQSPDQTAAGHLGCDDALLGLAVTVGDMYNGTWIACSSKQHCVLTMSCLPACLPACLSPSQARPACWLR